MTLNCALCLSLLTPRDTLAITVLNGSAVCRDHLGYMRLETFERSIDMARAREEIIEEEEVLARVFADIPADVHGDSSSAP